VLETLAQFGELVGGLGAIAALVYLAIQLRHSNALSRAQSRQTLLTTFAQITWEMSRDAHVLRVIAIGLRSWPDISNSEKTTFDLTMGRYLFNLQNGLLLRDAGMLDSKTLDEIADYMLACVVTEGGQRWWKETTVAPPQVREYIEWRLAHPETLPGRMDQLMPHWFAMAEENSEVG